MSKPSLNPAAQSATVAKPTDWPIMFVLNSTWTSPPTGYMTNNNVLGATWVPPKSVQNSLVAQNEDLIGVATACKSGNPYLIQTSDMAGRTFQPAAPGLAVAFDTEGAEAALTPSVWSAQTVPQVQLFAQNLQSIGNVIPLGFVHWRYQFDAGNINWQIRDLTTGFNANQAVQQWQAIKPIAQYTNYWCPAMYTTNTQYIAVTSDWYKGLGIGPCYPNNTPQALGPPIMPLVWGGVIEGGAVDDFSAIAQTVAQHADGVVVWGGWTDSGNLLQALVAARDSRQTAQPAAERATNVLTPSVAGGSTKTKTAVKPTPTAAPKTTVKFNPILPPAKGGSMTTLGFSAPILIATMIIVVCRRWIRPARLGTAR